MKKLLVSLTLAIAMLMVNVVPVAAATFTLPTKMTWKNRYYYDGEWGSWYSSKVKYKYDKRGNLNKRIVDGYADTIYKNIYKRKNRVKAKITEDSDTATVLFNKKKQLYKYNASFNTINYIYNRKGYIKTVKYKKPVKGFENKIKETWTYKYNGKKLKKAVHKYYNKKGITYEGVETHTFNKRGFPVKIVKKCPDTYDNKTHKITYKYKSGLVKSITMTEYDSEMKPVSTEKFIFSYGSKNISSFRYNMMIFGTINHYNCLWYGGNAPAFWY